MTPGVAVAVGVGVGGKVPLNTTPSFPPGTLIIDPNEVDADGVSIGDIDALIRNSADVALEGKTLTLVAKRFVNVGALNCFVTTDVTVLEADNTAIATITVTVMQDVLNEAGQFIPMPNIAAARIVITSTGTGNTIVQPTLPTGLDGATTGTFKTSVAELKTISATIDGILAIDTASIDASGGPAGPIFSDDFETGNLSHSENGVSWQTPDGAPDAIAGVGANGSFTRTSGTWVAGSQVGRVIYFQTTSGNVQGGFVNVMGPFTVTANDTTTLTFTGDATGAVQTMTHRAVVTDVMSHGGTYSLGYIFGPDLPEIDSRSQTGFNLPMPGVGELWLEYYLYIPANYAHRAQSGGITNNKFFGLFQRNRTADTSRMLFDFETVDNGADGSDMFAQSVLSTGSSSDAIHTFGDIGFTGTDIINAPGSPAVLGDWNLIRIHFKSETAASAADGVQELAINSTTVFRATGRSFGYPNIPGSAWFGTFPALLDSGYLLGASNSGYTELTQFFVDDVKVYTANPGW